MTTDKAAIEGLIAFIESDTRVNGDVALTECRKALPALQRLLAGETREAVQRWIPISESVPEPLVEVLGACVFDLDGETNIHLIYRKPGITHRWHFADPEDEEVGGAWKLTHWMPLPKTPNEFSSHQGPHHG